MRHYIIGLFLVVTYYLSAQQTGALEVYVGAATYLGDLEPEDVFPSLDIAHLSFGINASLPLRPTLLLRGGASYHSLVGNDDRNPDPEILNRGFSFTNKLVDASVQLLWEPFGKKRYPLEGGYKNIVSPYLFAGAGIAFLNTQTDYNEPLSNGYIDRVAKDKAAQTKNTLTIPFGGGLRFDLSKNMSLGLELSARKTNSDYLDGISISGTVNTDWYLSGGFTCIYRWSKPDYDRDGFMDEDDLCPLGAGPDYTQGCPDSDGDKIPDHEDLCPYQKGKIYVSGCPDTDYDGVADFIDKCPEIPGHKTGNGCVDSDGDGIINDEDMCPHCPATDGLSGCPDTDDDGVEDSRDRCPNMKGTLENGGCPFMDQDLDGVPDTNDACPAVKGLKQFDGCPDTDADGLIDKQDKCPQIAGTITNNGCPELSDDLRNAIKSLTANIQFETGSNQLTQGSKMTLLELVAILKSHPYYHLQIDGHTDSQGDNDNNLRLSQKRAKACYDFLNENEIDVDKMTYQGFGESKPIADNNTIEGRKKNRRVVFDLFVK